MDYELKIVKDDKEAYRVFDINNESIIGVKENEAFELHFKNNTSVRIQVRFSIDGTDILTGTLASTKPEGQMWLVEAYGSLKIKAWPENNNGGAQFIFTDEKKSVAVNTHGHKGAIGLIAAAVYVEKPGVSGNTIWWTYPTYTFPTLPTYDHWYKIGSPYIGGGGRTWGTNGTSGTSGTLGGGTLTSSTMPTYDTTVFSFNQCSDARGGEEPVEVAVASSELFSNNLAVGAGEQVEQHITNVSGLYQPVLNDIIQLRYVPWAKLEKMVAKSQTAFPADKEIKHIDLTNVPKVKSHKKNHIERFIAA